MLCIIFSYKYYAKRISFCVFFILIEIELMHKVVLTSAPQQSDSVIHIYSFYFIFFPSDSIRRLEIYTSHKKLLFVFVF